MWVRKLFPSPGFWYTLLVRLLIYAVLVLTGIVFLASCMEKTFIYQPVSYPEGNWDVPQTSMGAEIQDVHFHTDDDVRLHGWWVPRSDTSRTILWFHGNAGNLSHRYQDLLNFHNIGCQVLIIDYRGYGKSDGSPSEQGLYRDGLAAYSFLVEQKEIPKDQIVLLGRSLGAAVATKVANRREIDRLLLVSPFTNVRDMVPHVLPIPGLHYLISSEFNSLDRIRDIHVPLLIIHGTDDEIVPIELGRKLFERANSPKRFEALEGAGHNNISMVAGIKYQQLIREFIFED